MEYVTLIILMILEFSYPRTWACCAVYVGSNTFSFGWTQQLGFEGKACKSCFGLFIKISFWQDIDRVVCLCRLSTTTFLVEYCVELLFNWSLRLCWFILIVCVLATFLPVSTLLIFACLLLKNRCITTWGNNYGHLEIKQAAPSNILTIQGSSADGECAQSVWLNCTQAIYFIVGLSLVAYPNNRGSSN
jgi:hypothetical protein